MSKEKLINRDKVRGCMAEQKLTQEHISEYLGISRASFFNKMQCLTEFTEAEILLLKKKFGDVIFLNNLVANIENKVVE